MRKIIVAVILFSCSIVLRAQHYEFPLEISSSKRYLQDQQKKPFLYVSDSGWLLFFGLNLEETRKYFLLRKKQGFSAVHVMLTGTPGPKYVNRNGDAPFINNDIARPNEAFFTYVDKVVALADSCNMLLCLVPLWYSCCNDGWASNPYPYMKKAGVATCSAFGRYLGNRYKGYDNILWILGGDNDPGENRDEIAGLAVGIKAAAPKQLITYHASSTHSSTDVWNNASWLDLSMTYTYFRGFHKAWNYVQPDIYEVNYTEYKKGKIMPFLLGESTYENEHTEVAETVLQVRKQAYYTMLSGACGHSYGSPFYAVGRTELDSSNWEEIIHLPGANSLRYLNDLFAKFPWETLIPDIESLLISEKRNTYATNDYALAAYTADKQWAVMYIPSYRQFTVHASVLTSKKLNAFWYSPRNGQSVKIKEFNTSGSQTLTSPDKNDWVLVLQSLVK